MKKNYIVILGILLSIGANAKLFTIGPKLGISSSKVTVNETVNGISYTSGNAKTGFHGGVFARVSLPVFYVQPELLFTAAGGEIKSQNDIITKINYNRLDVPVMLGLKFLKVARVQFGPVANVLLAANSTTAGVKEAVKGNYKSINIGYQAGIGVDIFKLVVDLKYEGGFGPFGEKFGSNNQSINLNQSNSQFILSLGWKLL